MPITIAGAFLYGALALAGLFIFGLVTANHPVMLLAVLSAGLAYVCQVAAAFYEQHTMMAIARPAAMIAMAGSIGTAVVGFLWAL